MESILDKQKELKRDKTMQQSRTNLVPAQIVIHRDLNGQLERIAAQLDQDKQTIFAAAVGAFLVNRRLAAAIPAPYRGPAAYRLSIFYPADLHGQVKTLAVAEGVTQSAILTLALKNYLEG